MEFIFELIVEFFAEIFHATAQSSKTPKAVRYFLSFLFFTVAMCIPTSFLLLGIFSFKTSAIGGAFAFLLGIVFLFLLPYRFYQEYLKKLNPQTKILKYPFVILLFIFILFLYLLLGFYIHQCFGSFI